jgi:hypothetical protein
MRLMSRTLRYVAAAVLIIASAHGVEAATYDLPLDGTVSIVGNWSAQPIDIEIQAIENFSLPVFNQTNPMTTAAVYQWSSTFGVLNQNGSPAPEPALSPFGTSLTGYGQNCSVTPYCPHPSGESSETILTGSLLLSADDPTLQIATYLFAQNIPSYNLELQVTLPDNLSITPLPSTLPVFLTGIGVIGLFGWVRQRKSRALGLASPCRSGARTARQL